MRHSYSPFMLAKLHVRQTISRLHCLCLLRQLPVQLVSLERLHSGKHGGDDEKRCHKCVHSTFEIDTASEKLEQLQLRDAAVCSHIGQAIVVIAVAVDSPRLAQARKNTKISMQHPDNCQP